MTKANEIRMSFIPAENVLVHWDGKMLNLKGNIKSNRVCVYLTGVDEEKKKKLLGIPECCDGTGLSEFKIVENLLIDWNIFQASFYLTYFLATLNFLIYFNKLISKIKN